MGVEEGQKRRDGVEITTLGALAKGPWAKKYWSSSRGKDRYPYPVGYQAVRCYRGHNYYMEICEGKRGPNFRVTCEEGKTCSGETPNYVWESMLRKKHVGAKKLLGRPLTSGINGSEMFGFMDPVVQLLLRELLAAENGLANTSNSMCSGRDTHTRIVKDNILQQSVLPTTLQMQSGIGELVGPMICAVSPAPSVEEWACTATNNLANGEEKDKIGQMENIARIDLISNYHSNQESMTEQLITLHAVVSAAETVGESLPMNGSGLSFPLKTGHSSLASARKEKEPHLAEHNFEKISSSKFQEDEPRKSPECDSCMQLKAPRITKQLAVDAAKLKHPSGDSGGHPASPNSFAITSSLVSQEFTQQACLLDTRIGLIRDSISNKHARGESNQLENCVEARSGAQNHPEEEPPKEKQMTISQFAAVNLVEDIPPMKEHPPSAPVINEGAFLHVHDLLTVGPFLKQDSVLESDNEQDHHSKSLMHAFSSSELSNVNNGIKVEAPSLAQEVSETAIFSSVKADAVAGHLVVEGRLNKFGVATVLSPSCEIDLSSDTVPEERDVSDRDDELNISVAEVSMIFCSEDQSQKTESESMGQELTTSMVAILLPQAMSLLRKKSTKRKKKRSKPSIGEACYVKHMTSQNICEAPESGISVPVDCPVTYLSIREPCDIKGTAIGQSMGLDSNSNQKLYLDQGQTLWSENENLHVLPTMDGTPQCLNPLGSADANPMKPITNLNAVSLQIDYGNQRSEDEMRLHDSQIKQAEICNKNNNLLLDIADHSNSLKDTGNIAYEDSSSLIGTNSASYFVGIDNVPKEVSAQEAFHCICQDNRSEILNHDCLSGDRKHADGDFSDDDLLGEILDFEGLPSSHEGFVHPHILEPIVCLAQPIPVLAMCINVRCKNIRLCVCCGMADQQERYLFLYDVLAALEAKLTLLSVIDANLFTGLAKASTSYCVLEECGIRFTPNGEDLILLGCFRVTKKRINPEHVQTSMPSNHNTSNVINIFSFATEESSLKLSLEAEQQLQCLSIPSARILVAAGGQGYACCWRMKCNWRNFEEKFRLPSAQFKGVLFGNIIRLLAVPSLPNLVLGCDSSGSFAVWDWKKRVLLFSFKTNEFSFPKVHIIDKCLLAQCGELPARGFYSEENTLKNDGNWSCSSLKAGDCPCQKLNKPSSSEKGDSEHACKDFPQGSFSPPPYFLLVVKAELQEGVAEKGIINDFGNQELFKMGSWKPAALVNQTIVTGTGLDDRATIVTVMGRYGIAGLTDGKVYLWDILSGRRMTELSELEGLNITCMTAHQASASLAVAGEDGRVVLYVSMPTAEDVSKHQKLDALC